MTYKNLPADFPDDWDGPEPILATRSAICPLCHVFIAENASWIVPLVMAIPPLTLDGERCLATGGFYYWDGRPIRMHDRRWVHWYCYPKRRQRIAEARKAGWSM